MITELWAVFARPVHLWHMYCFYFLIFGRTCLRIPCRFTAILQEQVMLWLPLRAILLFWSQIFYFRLSSARAPGRSCEKTLIYLYLWYVTIWKWSWPVVKNIIRPYMLRLFFFFLNGSWCQNRLVRKWNCWQQSIAHVRAGSCQRWLWR